MRFLAIIGAIWMAAAAQAEPLVVFAASSLKGPLDEAIADWDGETVVSYGSSAALARQIELGAPADVFVSANADWVEYLSEVNQLRPGTSKELFTNRLVLISTAGAPPMALTSEAISDRLGDRLLAIGSTQAVPAGIYGKESLETLGLWSGLQGRLAEVENVRAALALVARGEVPLGLVYASDAQADASDVSVVAELPETSHQTIIYIGAVTARSTHDDAWGFVEYLKAEGAQPFLDVGFKEFWYQF